MTELIHTRDCVVALMVYICCTYLPVCMRIVIINISLFAPIKQLVDCFNHFSKNYSLQ